MQHQYLGRVPLKDALEQQDRIRQGVGLGAGGCILGFESEPVITLGVRARSLDLLCPEEVLRSRGFTLARLDRGGQATLHNPGQLVIFPVLDTRPFGGPRAWVCRLIKATQALARGWGEELRWDESRPGLYNEGGKAVAVGVRLHRGVSTHGLALNLHNDLAPFEWIRPCGLAGARVSHLKAQGRSCSEVFSMWVAAFQAEVDKTGNLAQFRELATDVRL